MSRRNERSRIQRCKKFIKGLSTAHKIILIIAGIIGGTVVVTLGVLNFLNTTYASNSVVKVVHEEVKLVGAKIDFVYQGQISQAASDIGALEEKRRGLEQLKREATRDIDRNRIQDQIDRVDRDIRYWEKKKQEFQNVLDGKQR